MQGPETGNPGRLRGRRERTPRAAAVIAIVALVSVVGAAWSTGNAECPASRDQSPVNEPRQEDICADVHGWIACGDESGIWPVDPANPGDRVSLSRRVGAPTAWSSDGPKLLILRGASPAAGNQDWELVVLESDGSETLLMRGHEEAGGGSFSPDGTEVVYATGWGGRRPLQFRGTAIEVIELGAFFRDPTAWALPRRMYVQREISPFVLSRLRVMYDDEPDWSVLPSPAREIVSSSLQTLIRDGCRFTSTDQAR